MKIPTVKFWLTAMLVIAGGWAGQLVAIPEAVTQTSPSPGDPWTSGVGNERKNRELTRAIDGSRANGFLDKNTKLYCKPSAEPSQTRDITVPTELPSPSVASY